MSDQPDHVSASSNGNGHGDGDPALAAHRSDVTVAASTTGMFELHVFVAPLDPDPQTVERFEEVCRAHSSEGRRIKALLLYLDFVHLGFAAVMQTSRYVQGTLDSAWREIARDAGALRDAGFEVLREKIEAVASNDHVPDDDEQARQIAGGTYFEYHLQVARQGDRDGGAPAITRDDEAGLRAIAAAIGRDLEAPVPLSYNALKPDRWFLNARTYGQGRQQSFARVQQIHDAIEATGSLRVVKVIREFIVGDTNKALDSGWLEPLP